jgi:hypothetical protein
MINIFNWAQDNNVKFIENIDFYIWKYFKKLYGIVRGSNRLSEKRAINICKKMFNIIGLSGSHNLERLIGFGDDTEDYYYITKNNRGEITWYTMVGEFIPLKGKISNWSYWRIEEGFQMFCPKEKKFLIKKQEAPDWSKIF